jgi:nucleoside-diphosphate-sugar epimerase
MDQIELETFHILWQASKKAKILLGYNPKFSLQEGLKAAVDWYWEELGARF